MPAPCPLTASLSLLLLLLSIARAGPFSPRSNVTLPPPKPPPQPGGPTGRGRPSSQLYEHTVEGGEKQVVFTHRINLPPSAGCGCPPGTEPPVPASEVQALRIRLEILEELVKGLKEQCTGGCCPAAAQAGTGQTDVRSLCSLHGVFDLSRCACSCEAGWSGPTCSDRTDAPAAEPSSASPPSAPASCPDDCNDQGRCVRGRCVCFPGYAGPSCGWPSCPGDCQGHGRCVQGVCVCRAGFSGDDCGQRTCPRGCSQRGRCEDGRCVCDPGYAGDDCAARSCPRGCSQRGRCDNGRCVCDPGYAGDDCGQRSCPGDCGDGGRCVDGRCVCWPGYAGDTCGTRTCPRDCHGRGRCEDGECLCDPGYSGDDCGVRACPGDCHQRGHCVDGRCVCWPGYSGPDCGARACPRDCRGRGRCEDGVCVCHAGYQGEDCGARACPGDCRGRGRCESGRCVCWPGYTGRDCGVRACPGDCRGRGRCVDGRCVCDPGFAGEDCGSRRCPGDCRGRGRCEDGVCVCSAGYEGDDCGALSCPGGCRGRGRCQDGRCVCDAGYAGEDCGVRRCPRDCSQRGACQDGVCLCWDGYAGDDCSLRTCTANCHGRGRCEDGRCVCDAGYTGPTCATRTCPADCRGRGRCVQGVCVCRAGYSGEDCGQEEPPSSGCPGGCGPRALCRGGQCVCVEGFQGPDCAIQMCPGDCRGRGECLQGRCVCQEGYAGEDCGEARVPSSASAYDQRGLAPGQEYQVTVRALRGTSWGPPTSKTITTMIDGPQDLRVVAVTPTTLQLSWLRPLAEVDRFVVSYVSAGNQRVRLEVPPKADGTMLTDLMPGVEYVVTVTAERGRAVSYPSSVRANTALPPRPRPRPTPGPPRPAPKEGREEAPPPRRTWANVTAAELGRHGGSVEDVERYLRAHRYPLRANQTYPSVARYIFAYLQRQVLGSSADGSLLVSLDGLRGQFERVVLRWRPQPPAEGPGGELAVPGSVRTVSLPDLRPGTTYHVEVHGVRAGQTSKSYAFITTTGSPPPSGPSTTEGARAPILQQRPQELAELRVLGRDETGRLRVAWTAQPDTFAHFQLRLLVPQGLGDHEELLPGDTRQALVPPPPPGAPYELLLHGIYPGGQASTPLTYQGILDRDGEQPASPGVPPRLGALTVTDVTPHSLLLHWTVPEGEFESFVIQYKDKDKPRVVPVEGPQRALPITSLEPGRKYKFVLYGLVGKKRHGPIVTEAKTVPWSDPSPGSPPRLGELWVTDPTPDSLRLSWTVPTGQFDSFVVQYRDRDGRPRVVPVEGPDRSVVVSALAPDHKYRFTLFGVANKKRHGPLVADGTTTPEKKEEPPRPEPPKQPLLGELTVTGMTPDSLRLSWTVAQGPFDSFVVQYKDAQGQPQAVPVGGDENEVTVSGLQSERKYKMNLYGLRGRQRVGPVSVVATTAPLSDAVEETPTPSEMEETPVPTEPTTEAPETPEEPLLGELTVTGSTSDSLSLSWTVPQGHFDSFTVQYKDRDGRPQAVRVGGEEREVTVKGLEPGRKYKMHLYGLHQGQRVGPESALGTTAPQQEEEAPTTNEPPQEPRLGELTVTEVTPNSVGLSWTVPEGEFDSFMVQYKDRDGQPQVVPVASDQRETTVPSLEPSHKYKFHLYGIQDGKRTGPLSVVAMTAPATEAPERAQEPHLGELVVTHVTPSSVALSWTVPEGEFDSFVVQYKDRDGKPQVEPVTAHRRETTVQGLEPSRKYKFLLFGIQDGKRRGPLSAEAKTAPQGADSSGAPPRLGELWVTDPTPDSLRLSWTVPEGHFDSFAVQFKDKDGPRVVSVEGPERSVTITPLEPGRKYRFLLYGLLDKRRHGPLSADGVTEPQRVAGKPGTQRPAKPRLGEELQVTGVTPDSVGLSWTVPEGEFDSFVVQYKDRDGQPQVVPVEGSLREVTVQGLDPARRYKLLLYGLHGDRRVGPLSVIAVTAAKEEGGDATEAPAPSEPEPRLGPLTVEKSTTDSLHLSWVVEEGQFDSFLVQYTDDHGRLRMVSLEGDRHDVTISGLRSYHRYLVDLYGFHGGRRVGPARIEALTAEEEEPSEPPTVTPEPPSKPRLGELTVTDTTPDSLSLSWTVPEGRFDHFLVQYRNGDGQPKAVRVQGHEDQVTISGLEPDHKYKMNLYGFQDGQRVGPISAVGVTEPTTEALETPEEPLLGQLTVTGSTSDSLDLSWTVPQGHFDSFTVQYKDRDGRPQAVRVGGEEREVTVQGLEPGRKYKMHLYGLHQGQRVGPVSALGLTAPPTAAPEPPFKSRLGELTVTDATPDSLSLSWTVPEGRFDHFLVQYRNGDGQPKAVRVPGHEDQVTISGLEPDHKYKMNLYGFQDGQRVGPISAVGETVRVTSTPPTDAPEPPLKPRLGELTVTDATPDSLSLSWTVPEGRFDHFLVQYRNGDGQPKAVRVPGHEDQVTISGLEPDHKYKMNLYGFQDGQRVGPISAIGETEEETLAPTEPTTEASETPEEPLLGELTVTGSTSDSLDLSWTVSQGHFDSFTVQYKDRDGRPQAVRVGGEEREVTVQGLEPGRKYKMHLYGLHQGRRVGPVSALGLTAPEEEPPVPAAPSPTTVHDLQKPRLGELTVTDATPDSLSLSWTVPEGRFDHFLVQYRNGDGQPKVVRVPGHEDQVTISGLEPDHKYKMNLYGFQDGQRVGPVSAVGVTEEAVTLAPTVPSTEHPEPPLKPRLGLLTVTDATPDSLSLSWTVPEGRFDHFLVQYRNGDGQPKAVRVPGHEDQVTISGLEPDHKYKMNLYGFQDGQRVGPVSAVGVTEEETPAPTEPTTEAPETPEEPLLGELTVTGSTSDSLDLSWTVPQGHFDSFTVQYKDRDGRPQAVRVGGEEREVTVQGLEPGRKYKMHLYGLHQGRRVGPVSALGLTAPPTAAPEPPFKPRLGELTVTDATPDSLSLSWTVPEGHFDHFLVQYRNGDGQPKAVRVSGHEDQVTISGLEPDHKYKMNLYGFQDGQRVGPISAVGVTEEETLAPTEPTTEVPETPEEPLLGELTVTGSTSDSLDLSWTVPQGHFDSFTVQYKDRDGQPQAVRVGGEEREVTVQGLEPGRKYKMHLYGLHQGRRVGPVSVLGLTAPEEEVSVTSAPPMVTPEPPFKPRLGELTVTDATPDSLSLSWTVPEGRFDHFLVQYRNGDGQPKVVRVPGHEDQVTISGLEPDHKYKMNLYGFQDGQRVGPVSAIGVTEEETPAPTEPTTEAPETPEEPLLGELTVTGSTSDSLGLSWTVPQGHFDSFTVQYKDRDGRPQAVRVGGEEREVTVQGLEPGRKYKMHLYGLHQGRRVGPVSALGLTAPLPTEPPVEPRLGQLVVSAVTLNTASLVWTVDQGSFDSFLVQYRDVQGQLQTLPAGAELREVTVSDLEPARKYKFLLFGLQDGKRRGPVSVEAKTLSDTKPQPRLGELTVTEATPDSVGLSWTVPEGVFDSFVVQYKDKDGQPQAVSAASDQREVTIPGLHPNRKYKFLLYGLAGRKRLGPVSAEGTTAPLQEKQPPPRLKELTVTDATPDSLRLLWTVAQGPFDSFVVQYRDTDGQPQGVTVAGDQREVTVEGLQPGSKYKFLLYGHLGGRRLGPISALGVTAPEEATPAPLHRTTEAPQPPEEPRLGTLEVSDVTPDSLSLSWTVARGPFDSFVIQYQDTDGQPQALLVGNNQYQVLVSGLQPGTSYRFFLYGLREGTRLGPVSVEGTTGQAPPAQPPGEPSPRLSQLSVTDVTTSSLRLNWEAPTGGFDSFLLRFGVPPPSTLELHPLPLLQRELTVPGTLRSAVLRDLQPGTLYSLTLYGLRGPHKADSAQGTARTLNPVLESPRDLQFSDIEETSAKVSWLPPPSRVDSFKVSYQLADGGEPQSVQVDGRTQTQTLRGLTPSTRYEVTVVSVRGFEESEPLTGFLTTVPDGPTDLHALNLTETSALLHWTPPQKPVNEYEVKVTAPGAPSLQGSAPGSAEDYPLQDLKLHTNYTAIVRGVRGPNFTSPANITFTTGLEAPQVLEAKKVTPRTALLTWTEPRDLPTGYLLSFDTPGGQTQEIPLPGSVTSHQLRGLFPSTPYSARLRAVWDRSFSPPVSTTFTTGGLKIPFPRDCGEEMKNGISTSRATTIFLNGNRERPLDVFCDMETEGGGWLVFQRRVDGQTDFWRDWEDYAHGFGNISGEFWLGNEALHSLTQAGDYSLRVDLRAGDEAVFAQYDSFRVDSAAQHYRLHLDGYHGTAGDSMSYHSGSVFSARDRDPNNLLISCAVSYRGAWWYRNCHYANLNGLYGSTVDHQGMSWYHWKGFDFSVPFTEMKLRPRSYQRPTRGG
ncbi:tenascin-X [Tenrec ecaudatus]|uniref:tenascin-X n=1 Tax=Tenrec ecaudatus TaxID=94439 RepID=UPI003F59931B